MSEMIGTIGEEAPLYYYGNISRETAEYILWERGCFDGMFLLRDSNSDYVLSLCHHKRLVASF
ncbi:tyrosine-protein kinase SYK-like protein [Dinothrombium tinctorium]|uniref:Tyrosine-protein kinase SYK-like protein n=1 Tax=Dinothrombium tinctorium TaxID=1965070 RepID=A0A3S3P4L6_9ACAR|nr:tyrosine-protein kinase SYK-like protein [Dinothrombium tinctorium]